MSDTAKKVNAKFTRTDDSEVIVKGIDEDEMIMTVGDLNDQRADGLDPEDYPVSIPIGPIKKIDLIDQDDKELQTVYGDKNNR